MNYIYKVIFVLHSMFVTYVAVSYTFVCIIQHVRLISPLGGRGSHFGRW
jgi:hypothetical protein